MIKFIKVLFHTLFRVFKPGHSMCHSTIPEVAHTFCECGYENNGVSFAEVQLKYWRW
jgi:hypothetical protein